MIIHATPADFILFLYVHMSFADHNYDPAEMESIKMKMADLFPPETDFEKKLYHAIREYNTFDKSKLNDLLVHSFDHFFHDKEAQKRRVYADMREIIMADGNVSASESSALSLLKQIISNLHTESGQ